MENFTPWASLVGGLLIGLASATLMVTRGKIAGVSGIAAKVLSRPAQAGWRVWFMVGLVGGGALMGFVLPSQFAFTLDRSIIALIAGGLLVGFGTQLGSGCTSGHGICGLSRLSKRSFAAVGVFMATAAATVAVVHAALGGAI